MYTPEKFPAPFHIPFELTKDESKLVTTVGVAHNNSDVPFLRTHNGFTYRVKQYFGFLDGKHWCWFERIDHLRLVA